MDEAALVLKVRSVVALPGSCGMAFDAISSVVIVFVSEMRLSRGEGRCGAGTLVGSASLLLVDGTAWSSSV
ncbi:hypothetical protein [Bradyrhizobium genosp. P]|uniref:hypothetical protein n=1 Tax=Bradyrhizobium genosp. P TaxID=83641 RepID=UPI003CF80364